jgi:fermentation-respiration switch protein FrsA (DUF1100 family)
MVIASFLLSLLAGGLGGIIGILGLLFGTACYLVETLTRPQKRSRFAHYGVSPFELGLPAETVSFPPRTGRHLVSGWYVAVPGAAATIIVCPGYRTRKSQTLAMVKVLWQAGYNVLAFEYYGHGAPVGARVTLGYRERDDFLGALDYARQRAPNTQLGVLAYSMGAAVAIMCSAHAPEVKALIADSAFATHRSAVHYNVRRAFHLPGVPLQIWLANSVVWLGDHLLGWLGGYRFCQVEPIRDIAHIAPRPLLLIHGGQDSIVDPHDGDLLYAAAKPPKEHWVVKEADHCGAYFEDRAAYIARVLAFFDASFSATLKKAVTDLQGGAEADEEAESIL